MIVLVDYSTYSVQYSAYIVDRKLLSMSEVYLIPNNPRLSFFSWKLVHCVPSLNQHPCVFGENLFRTFRPHYLLKREEAISCLLTNL